MRQEWNVSTSLDMAYANTANALHYAGLLARHAQAIQPQLVDDPGTASFALNFQTDNHEVPRLAREQFPMEVARYSLVFALAHFDRFVLDLAVCEAVVAGVVAAGGAMNLEQVAAIEKSERTIKPYRSVARELDRLAGSTNDDVLAGIAWFRGLYAIRTCLVHRAAIVDSVDSKLLKGIIWKRTAISIGDEELTGSFPQAVTGGVISLQFKDVTRSWSIGERVTITSDEIQQMMWSLERLATLLVHHLNADFAARLGLQIPPA